MILPILLIALSALDQAVVDSDYFATATQRERCATVLRIRQDGTGTGVVIAWDAETRAAYAVTAYHVVDGRGEITAESFSSDQSSPIIKQSFRDLQVVAFDAPAFLIHLGQMGLRAHVAEFRTTPIPFQRFAVVPEIELVDAADIRERHQVTLIGRFEQIGQAFGLSQVVWVLVLANISHAIQTREP